MSDQTPQPPAQPTPPPAAPPSYPAAAPAAAYPPPAGYPQQPGYTPFPTTPKTNTLAIVSLISSLAGVVIVPFIGQIVGIITGHIALNQIKQRSENGRGLALTGVIVGYVSFAIYIVLTIAFIGFFVALVNSGFYTEYDYS